MATPTLAELQKQRMQLAEQINVLNTSVLDFSTTGQDAFFKATGEQKAAPKKKVPRYTDVYNTEFDKIKDVDFTVSNDVRTAETGDKAFYVFNAAKTAEQNTNKIIENVENLNKAYDLQQTRIQNWLKNTQNTAIEMTMATYIDPIIKKNTALQQGIVSISADNLSYNSPEYTKWKNSSWKKSNYIWKEDMFGRRYQALELSYKVSEEEKQKLIAAAKVSEQAKFKASPELQKQAKNTLLNKLNADLAKLDSQIKKMK